MKEYPPSEPAVNEPRDSRTIRRLLIVGVALGAYVVMLYLTGGLAPRTATRNDAPSATTATAAATHSTSRPAPKRVVSPEVEQAILDAREAGIIQSMDVDANRVYVDPVLWTIMNVNQKRGFAFLVAKYFGERGSTNRAEIYDFQSGKRLATQGAFGFRVEE